MPYANVLEATEVSGSWQKRSARIARGLCYTNNQIGKGSCDGRVKTRLVAPVMDVGNQSWKRTR